MLKQLPTNHLPWGRVLVLGLVLMTVLSLPGTTGARAASAQTIESCKAVGTPY